MPEEAQLGEERLDGGVKAIGLVTLLADLADGDGHGHEDLVAGGVAAGFSE